MEAVIALIIVAIIVIAILYIISIWIYKRAPSNMCFIRTGFLGTKVCLGKGAVVLPVFHEVTWVSLETMKLIVSRARDAAILTHDNIRVDVVAELYAHVGHTEADVLTASRSLGEKTFDAEKVRNLLEAKVVSALRSYAATKTLKELHENRDSFAREIKESVLESFKANGLTLEEVTVVTLEQSSKEYFKTDNVFDAEGLKVITEITSNARRAVHDTEKRTTVSIRQKDLDTQLELLEIERQEAFARANQDKEVSNEQALQLGQKQIYVLDQRMAVEQREIENEKNLERMRTERDIAVTEEAQRREISEIKKALALEQERRDREIAIIAKAREEELADIQRKLALEKAEKDRQIELSAKSEAAEIAEIRRALARERAEKDKEIELSGKERERQTADIERVTAVMAEEEQARQARHDAAEAAAIAMRKRTLETRLASLDLDKEEAFASAQQEQEVSNERARVLSEQQRFILEQRWQVEQEEIAKELAVEKARIHKEAQVADEAKLREAAEIRRALAREQEERDREIAIVEKTRQLEEAEIRRLETTALRERAAHGMESVRILADAERNRELVRIGAEREAGARRIDEENKAQITRMHMITQSEARRLAAQEESEATLIRARATSEAQKITAEGIEAEAGATGRAEMAIETLRVANTQRMLEAEARGLEAKAEALAKYNDAATFLELAKLRIEAEHTIHVEQARAMGTALTGAQIRMYGGGGDGADGTIGTIRSMFTSGFALGEILEGVAQSLPDGMRQRLTQNGIRGLFGRPWNQGELQGLSARLEPLVRRTMRTRRDRDIPLSEAVERLREAAGEDAEAAGAVAALARLNQSGAFDQVPFDNVWSLLQAAARAPAAAEAEDDD